MYSTPGTPTLVPAVTTVWALVYWTMTSRAEIASNPAMDAEKLPSLSSKAVLPLPASRPKLASCSDSPMTPSMPRLASTARPAAWMSVPDFLNAKSPSSLTKSATSALKPLTPKATVWAAIACAKVYSMSSTPTWVPAATEVPALVYWTMTSSAVTPVKPSMPAEKEPRDSSKAVLPLPAIRPKPASASRT